MITPHVILESQSWWQDQRLWNTASYLCNSTSVDLKYFCSASNSISFSRCVSMAWLALLSACSALSVFSTLSSARKIKKNKIKIKICSVWKEYFRKEVKDMPCSRIIYLPTSCLSFLAFQLPLPFPQLFPAIGYFLPLPTNQRKQERVAID